MLVRLPFGKFNNSFSCSFKSKISRIVSKFCHSMCWFKSVHSKTVQALSFYLISAISWSLRSIKMANTPVVQFLMPNFSIVLFMLWLGEQKYTISFPRQFVLNWLSRFPINALAIARFKCIKLITLLALTTAKLLWWVLAISARLFFLSPSLSGNSTILLLPAVLCDCI